MHGPKRRYMLRAPTSRVGSSGTHGTPCRKGAVMLTAFALSALVAASAAAQAAQAPQAPPAPTTTSAEAPRATGAKIWIGHEREIEEYIKTAPIDHVAKVPVGVTHPTHAFFAPGGPAAGVVFKQLPPGRREGYFESYKS